MERKVWRVRCAPVRWLTLRERRKNASFFKKYYLFWVAGRPLENVPVRDHDGGLHVAHDGHRLKRGLGLEQRT